MVDRKQLGPALRLGIKKHVVPESLLKEFSSVVMK
jgi:hypothetical protein